MRDILCAAKDFDDLKQTVAALELDLSKKLEAAKERERELELEAMRLHFADKQKAEELEALSQEFAAHKERAAATLAQTVAEIEKKIEKETIPIADFYALSSKLESLRIRCAENLAEKEDVLAWEDKFNKLLVEKMLADESVVALSVENGALRRAASDAEGQAQALSEQTESQAQDIAALRRELGKLKDELDEQRTENAKLARAPDTVKEADVNDVKLVFFVRTKH